MTALTAPIVGDSPTVGWGSDETASIDSRFAVLAGTLAHELKNPLASAITNLAVAKEFCDTSDPMQSFLARTDSELERIDRILRACIELACSDRLQRSPVEILPLLEDCAGDQVEIVSAPRDAAFVDATLVRRAIENVVENARRFVRAGQASRIELAASREGEDLVIYVADDGPGVPEELVLSIFDTLVSGGTGSGLGLSIVRRICRAHDGEVTLFPTADRAAASRGAVFELRFGAAFKGKAH